MSRGVDSFSQPNQSATTAAANPVLHPNGHSARTTFQVVQSRFGLTTKPDPKLLGRLEFDFIDFTRASPTTGALPRVRRAVFAYKLSDNSVLRVGQGWDLISPLAPHTLNYVGHYFESGDIGFMRIQAQYLCSGGNRLWRYFSYRLLRGPYGNLFFGELL